MILQPTWLAGMRSEPSRDSSSVCYKQEVMLLWI